MKNSLAVVLALIVGLASVGQADDVRVRASGGFHGGGGGGEVRSGGNGGGGGVAHVGAVQSHGGVSVRSRVAVGAPRFHTTVARNTRVVRNITREQRVEVVPNRYYWHNVGRTRYAHYYYHGAHWYGFYNGPRFYWSRYYSNHWWWYDPGFGRWSFWWAGYWWWPGPGGVVYVYNNDGYVPYDQAGVTVAQPDAVPEVPDDAPLPPATADGTVPAANAPASTPPPVLSDHSVTSSDNTRIVQVVGPDSEAFLYDNSSGKQVFMKHLDKKVLNARFSGGTNGQALQILLDFQDGHFALFNANGDPINAETSK